MGRYSLYHVLVYERIGVTIQKKNTNPIPTFASAHQGVANGLPIKAIWLQSNVTSDIPKPDVYPNNWLILIFLGAIQQTQENWERAVKMYPGKKYQVNEPMNAKRKNRSREMPL